MNKENGVMESRGKRLRKLREAKGLSLEQACQKTKINIGILKALEQDAIEHMAPAYLKGLLKIYCAVLGVDPKDFVEEHPKDEPSEKDVPDSSKIQTGPILVKPHVNISLIKKQIIRKPVVFFICLLVLSISAFKFGRNISVHRIFRFKKSPPASVATKPEVSPSSAPVISKPKLGIRAKEDCWLEVKLDGKTVFRSILKKGYFEHWEAKQSITFSLGNAAGVDVEVNGALLPSLGRRGQVIKNIVITKEGLTVPK